MSEPNFMAIDQIVDEIFQSGSNWLTEEKKFAYHLSVDALKLVCASNK